MRFSYQLHHGFVERLPLAFAARTCQQARVDLLIALHLSRVLVHKVHLAEQVDVGAFEVDHARHGGHDACKELVSVLHELTLEQIRCADVDVEFGRERFDQLRHDGKVGVEFNLTLRRM